MNEAAPTKNDRDLAIERIRLAMKRRTGRAWSVRGGRGTVWGWITISAPPARVADGKHTEEDARTLAEIFGQPASHFRYANGCIVSPQERREIVRLVSYGAPLGLSAHASNDNS